MSDMSLRSCTTPRATRAADSLNSLATESHMNRTPRSSRYRALWSLALPILALMTLGSASGLQAQTPEGDTIPNIATVSFTDANGNTYLDVADTLSLVVGFQAAITVQAPADRTPAVGTPDTLPFLLINGGNGNDAFQVDGTTLGGTVVSSVVYLYDGTEYPDIASLNAALSADSVAPGASAEVGVIYTPNPGTGGVSEDFTLDASSTRDGDADTDTVNITPALAGTVDVLAPADTTQLPNPSGAVYTASFDVTNSLSGTDNLALVASLDGPNAAGLTIVSVNGVAGDSALVEFTAGTTTPIVVEYRVANNAAGAASTLTLTSTAESALETASDGLTVTIIRPAVTIVKEAFEDAAFTTPITDFGEVLPGETIHYRITVVNGGTADAASVDLTDVLDPRLTYVTSALVSGTVVSGPTESAGTVTVDIGTLAVSASVVVRIEVTVN